MATAGRIAFIQAAAYLDAASDSIYKAERGLLDKYANPELGREGKRVLKRIHKMLIEIRALHLDTVSGSLP